METNGRNRSAGLENGYSCKVLGTKIPNRIEAYQDK